jgi:bifunctional NMN adenylyltransferase/nudix hydrolase
MSYKYDLAVFIGRFQPFHNGHKTVIENALKQSKHVLVLTGSAYRPRTPRNPWTASERAHMIASAMPEYEDRLWIRPVSDQKYNDQQWVQSVQTLVTTTITQLGRSDKPTSDWKIAIIGHSKDDTSYYLKMFPQWDPIEHPMVDLLNATDIRQIFFEDRSLSYLNGILPPSVLQGITAFKETPEFVEVKDYYEQVKANNKKWAGSPYTPMFITTDAVVIQSGHILLVTRKSNPGKDLLALPGGYLNPKEFIVDGMIRELREETKLKVPVPVLKGSIKHAHVFDDPNRSDRGRIVTHAYLIELQPGELPKVKGSDDAKHADWYPLSELRSENFFEDHFDIIRFMTGQL